MRRGKTSVLTIRRIVRTSGTYLRRPLAWLAVASNMFFFRLVLIVLCVVFSGILNVLSPRVTPTAIDPAEAEYWVSIGPVTGSTTAAFTYASVFNPSGSGRTLVAKRIRINSDAVAAATFQDLSLYRTTAASGGTQILPADIPKKNTDSSNSVAQIRYSGVTTTPATTAMMSVVAAGAVGNANGGKDFTFTNQQLVLQPGEGISLAQTVAGDTDQRIRLAVEWEEVASAPTATNDFMLAYPAVAVAATANYKYQTLMNPTGSGKTALISRLNLDVDCNGAAVYTNQISIQRISAASAGTQITSANIPKKHTGGSASIMEARHTNVTATVSGAPNSIIDQVTPCAVANEPHAHDELTFGSTTEALVLQPGEGITLMSTTVGDINQLVRLSAVWSEQASAPTAANEYTMSLGPITGTATSGYNYASFYNPAASGKTAVIHRVNIVNDAVAAAVSVAMTMQRFTATPSAGTAVTTTTIPKNNSSSGTSAMDIRTAGPAVTKPGAAARLMTADTPAAAGQLVGHNLRDFGSDQPIILKPGEGVVVYQEAAGDLDFRVNISFEWGEQASTPTNTGEYMYNAGPLTGSATSGFNYLTFMNSGSNYMVFHRLYVNQDATGAATYVPLSVQRISAASAGGTAVTTTDVPVKNTSTATTGAAIRINGITTLTKTGSANARLNSVTTPGAAATATAPQVSGNSEYDFDGTEALVLAPGEGIVVFQEAAATTLLKVRIQMEWAELGSAPTSQGEYSMSTGPVTGSSTSGYVYSSFANPSNTNKRYVIKRIEIRADRIGAATGGYIPVTVRRASGTVTGGTSIATTDIPEKNSATATSTADIRTAGSSFATSPTTASRLMGITAPGAVGQDSGLNLASIISGDELILQPGEGLALYQEAAAGDVNMRYRMRIVWSEVTIPPTVFNHAAYRLFNNQDTTAPTSSLGFSGYSTVFGDTGTDGVAAADFNGDGKQDLALANDTTSNISIQLGNGSGGFSAGTVRTTGTNPYDIVAADFNGDGKQDLATADNGSAKVSVLIGSGTGTFAAAVDSTISAGTQALTAADITGDGKADIITANNSANTVSVLINTGTGTFPASSTNYTTGTGPQDVVAADFSGDGKLDLATADRSASKMSVLINSGTGTFPSHTDYTAGTGTYGVTAADFTGDGKIDIATSNSSAATMSIFTNGGTGTFTLTSSPAIASGPDYILSTDIDGDGEIDLAAAANGASQISVVLGTGTGTFGSASNFTVDSGPTQITSADFNGDTKPDLVSTSYLIASGSVLLNTSSFSATPIDVSTALAALNTPATIATSTAFRLRLDIGVSTTKLAAAAQSFKLQYAPMTTSCDTAFVNTTSAAYADVTAATTVGYYDNPNATNGMSFATNANDPTDSTNTITPQTYQESGTTTFSNTSALALSEDGMWDFALTTNSATGGASYCLRVVKSTGTALDTYTVLPKITMSGGGNTAPNNPTALDQQTTGGVSITTGAWKNSQSVKFVASATDTNNPDTLALCVEKDAIATSFSNTEDSCGTPVSYSGSTVFPSVTIASIPDATQYHWQARLKDTAGAYSSWVSFGANLETVADFGVDTTAPTGGTVFDGTGAGVDGSFNTGLLTTLSANWSGISSAAAGLTGYEYSIGTTAGGITVKGWTSTGTTASMTDATLSLQTSQMYYVNVRTTDAAGNVSTPISSNGQVVAPSVSFTVSPSTVTFNHLKASNPTPYTDTQTTTLTTSTNAYGGYIVRAYNTGTLLASNGSTIGMFNGGTYAAPDGWLGGDVGFGYTSNDPLVQGVNKFSPTTCSGGGAPPCYAPFTLTAPGDIVADHATGVLGTAIAAEPFILTYRVTTTATQAASNYKTVTVYSVTPIY